MKPDRPLVLFIVPTLTGGGAERVIVTLLRHLDRSRFRLALAVIDMHQAVYRDEVPADVEFIDLQAARVRKALPAIIRLVWRMRPAVVFSTVGHLNLALALVRPLLPGGTRYIGREASLLSENLWDERWPRLWLWAYARFYPRFDALVCQSRGMRDDLVTRIGLPGAKAVLIHNPLEVDRIRALAGSALARRARSGGESLEIVAAGRLVTEKGFDLLIDALALIPDIDCRVTMLGDGPLRAELEHRVVGHGLSGRVRFTGFQRNPYPFYARADVFVLSSRYEAFPNAVLEALACGTPVIAVPAPGGIGEIAEITGAVSVVAAHTAEALAAGLRTFASVPRGPGPVVLEPFLPARVIALYERLFAGDNPMTGVAA